MRRRRRVDGVYFFVSSMYVDTLAPNRRVRPGGINWLHKHLQIGSRQGPHIAAFAVCGISNWLVADSLPVCPQKGCMRRERSPPANKMTSSDRANLLDKDEEIATPAKKPTITTKKLALSISGVFILYVLHDALQERAFRQPGFRFGWFMTLIEIVVVSTCAFMFEWGAPPDPTVVSEDAMRTIRMCVGGLALCLATSQGTGSAALNYVHYPVKVAFKSSKLVPTMIFGILLTRKTFSILEYGAALLMCCSLAGLSLADRRASSDAEAENLPLGVMLLMTAVFADALVPNLQEKCLKELKYPVGRMIVYSNAGCAALVLLYCSATGELSMALKWCASNTEGSAFLFLQACTSYICLLYTSPSPRDRQKSRMPSSA